MSSHTLITQPDLVPSHGKGEKSSLAILGLDVSLTLPSTVEHMSVKGSLFSMDQQQNPLTDFRTAMK
jgi:hypothetical protein